VTGLLAAALAAYGVFLIYTAAVFRWRGLGLGPPAAPRRRRHRIDEWLAQAGLSGAGAGELAAPVAVFFGLGTVVALALFGGPLPAIIAGGFAATFPLASYRARRERRLVAARQSWPAMLEELRLLTGSMGHSVPQAILRVGLHGPEELRPSFQAAEREWLLTHDFARTLDVLRQQLADATADVVCETLVVANEVGGGELDRRLADLIEDRALDLQGRRDAEVKQSGVRFARRFVLLVPLGMAVAGLSIGTGRSAYTTTGGQVGVAISLLSVVACWMWAGRLMRLPQEPRVFSRSRDEHPS
jgi:tight adherence protein B